MPAAPFRPVAGCESRHAPLAGLLLSAVIAAGCGETATLPAETGYGPAPQLPEPKRTLIPTVNVAEASGWPSGVTPVPAPGLAVQAFADGLAHPRWLYVLPNGDVLVAETDAPPKPEDGQGLKGWIMKWFMKRAGSSTPSANRITLLRDADGDGRPETRTVFLEGLNSPFGMALVGEDFYVANTDALLRFPYRRGDTQIRAAPVKLADLPGGAPLGDADALGLQDTDLDRARVAREVECGARDDLVLVVLPIGFGHRLSVDEGRAHARHERGRDRRREDPVEHAARRRRARGATRARPRCAAAA